jgi:hypothetical protein
VLARHSNGKTHIGHEQGREEGSNQADLSADKATHTAQRTPHLGRSSPPSERATLVDY